MTHLNMLSGNAVKIGLVAMWVMVSSGLLPAKNGVSAKFYEVRAVEMSMDSKELSEAIWEYGQKHGFEDMAGICARTLVGLAHAAGGNELVFTCDQGRVNIVPVVIPKRKQN
jgi:hypothetical protein